MPIFAAVLGHVLTNKRLTAALLASLAQLARARDCNLGVVGSNPTRGSTAKKG